MWRIVTVALLAAACSTQKREIPEGHAEIDQHIDYAEYRPVTIAVLPVKAPTADLRVEVPSTSREFDEAALRAVRSSSPLPPLPRGYTEDDLGINLIVE